jgi:hypothetical protein
MPRIARYSAKEKEKERAFGKSPIIALFKKRGERSQGRVHSAAIAEEWIGAKRRPLTAEGRQPLSFCLIHYRKTGFWRQVCSNHN